MFTKLEYGDCSYHNPNVYIFIDSLNDDQIMYTAFLIDFLLFDTLLTPKCNENYLYSRFPIYWHDVLVAHFGCASVRYDPKQKYDILDYCPLIECGDVYIDSNEINEALYHPFNCNKTDIIKTIVNSHKNHISLPN